MLKVILVFVMKMVPGFCLAVESGALTIGFCLLSAGVSRGNRSLSDVIEICLRTLMSDSESPWTEESVFAFLEEEQVCIKTVFENLKNEE